MARAPFHAAKESPVMAEDAISPPSEALAESTVGWLREGQEFPHSQDTPDLSTTWLAGEVQSIWGACVAAEIEA
ncbi:hypothetical protein N7451_004597 [Penicillium sp. IBT 35674x]|nr:hypothetical protein N7451_004597 [Penicillium sp. IBT 35674x]